ncbi:acyltransferase family protein [Bradyrhizobium sp. USDA 4454]
MDQKLEGLQVGRALAALSVAYFHSWHVTLPFPPDTAHPIPLLRDYGELGVHLFFTISGFVICIVVTSPRFAIANFVTQRFFRIWPLWIATSIVYLYLTRYLGRDPNQTIGAFVYSLTLLPTEGNPFYDVGWSLQHEIAFYLVAALIAPRLGAYALVALLSLCALADHALSLPWYLHQYFSFYPYFVAGIIAFLLHRRAGQLGVIAPLVAGIVLLWLLPRAFYPIPMFCLLIGLANFKPRTVFGEVLVALGNASYSIYLIHALVFYDVYIHLQPPLPPLWVQEPLRFGALIVICLLSLASWRYFETPMISVGRKWLRASAQS